MERHDEFERANMRGDARRGPCQESPNRR